MLTATYSLIALANERNAVRRILRKVQQRIGAARRQVHGAESASVPLIFDQLIRFDVLCRARKVVQYVIPAIRNVTVEADGLIAELDALSAAAVDLLRAVGGRLTPGKGSLAAEVDELYGALDLYCIKMDTRLDKEETELLSIARQVLSVEQWFGLAEQFLSDDRGVASQVLPMPPDAMGLAQAEMLMAE